jgi:hypothetical protein
MIFSNSLFFDNLVKNDFFKKWQECQLFYMQTIIHLRYLAQFLLEYEMFQTKCSQNQRTLCMFPSAVRHMVVYQKMYHNLIDPEKQHT